MNANARPPYTISKPRSSKPSPYRAGDTMGNMRAAVAEIKRQGFKVSASHRDPDLIATASPKGQYVNVNPSSPFWKDPNTTMRDLRRRGRVSTADPRGALAHEFGHLRDRRADDRSPRPAPRVASRVSRYAQESPREFVAEVYAGLRTGKRYDREVMQAYRQEAGLGRPLSRRRSRLKR